MLQRGTSLPDMFTKISFLKVMVLAHKWSDQWNRIENRNKISPSTYRALGL